MGDGHCPYLNPQEWDCRFWNWNNKPFYRATYWSVLQIPLNLDSVVEKALADIRSRELMGEPVIILSREESMFHSSLLISIREDTDQLPVETLTGIYYSRLFEGSYGEIQKYMRELKADLGERKLPSREFLVYNVTCPGCVDERGKAQTVIFARVK